MHRRCWLLLAALAGVQAAAQTEPTVQLAWRCWYDQRVHLTCVLRSAPQEIAPVPLPPNLPGVVRELRNRPQAFRNRFVHIPLIAPAIDLRRVAVLARATMCGSRRDCTVHFEPVPPSAAELATLQARLLEAEQEATLLGSAVPQPAE